MFGRRGYQRLVIRDSAQGVMRVLRDVVVQKTKNDNWLAVSREAAVVGEILILDGNVHHAAPAHRVRVASSRPVIINGSLRHRMRLEPLPGDTRG